MTPQILIVGGGVGGTIVANLLARTLHPQEAHITLIDCTGKHVYMPTWLYMPFNHLDAKSDQLVRSEQQLLNRHVHLVTGAVQAIDPTRREVHIQPDRQHHNGSADVRETISPYEYLVLATGARLEPADLPGLAQENGQWNHFYSTEGVLHLRQALRAFTGGRIVIAVGGIPYRCPPAPLEFTFLLDEWLRKQGLRAKSEIEYLSRYHECFPLRALRKSSRRFWRSEASRIRPFLILKQWM